MEDIFNTVSFSNNSSKWIACGIYLNVPDDEIINQLDNIDKLDFDNLLIIACWKGSESIIRKLIQKGANIEATSLFGSTPLLFIAQRDRVDIFKYLIELGANLYTKNTYGNDAEYYSSNNPNKNVYNYIQELKKDKIKIINDLIKDKEFMMKKNQELEDKINYLMDQLNFIQLNAMEDRIRKKPKVSFIETNIDNTNMIN